MGAKIGARVVIAGASGYLGRSLSAELVRRGHAVVGVVRAQSRSRLAGGVEAVSGDPLDAASLASALTPRDTLVQLVGTPKPAPWKARAFREVDLRAGLAAVEAVKRAQAAQLVYVSVAQPAPAMHAYLAVRAEVERAIAAVGIDASVLRPWYVLGPGHRWPWILKPVYALLERIPSTRESAQRLGFVSLAEMTAALAWAVEHPPHGARIVAVPQIRECARSPAPNPRDLA